MSNKRITDLTELTNPTTDDVFPVVDIATNTTTKVQLGNLPVPSSVTTALATKQDTLVSGTNIKTLNNTSLLGSGNITLNATPSGVAGAIQFSNGSAFASDASNLFWDDTNNRLGVGTNVPTVAVDIYSAFTASAMLKVFNGYTSREACIDFRSQSNQMYFGGAGLFVSTTAAIGTIDSLPARLGIKGSGSTSATTSLLVQNSAGTASFQIKDDGNSYLGQFNTASGNNVLDQFTAKLFTLTNAFVSHSVGSTYNGSTGDSSLALCGLGVGGGFFGGIRMFTSSSSATPVLAMIVDRNQSVGIGLTNSTDLTVNASAKLQVDSTTKGFLPPRMTTTQKNAIASPAAGLVVYDSTTNKLCCYNGSTWNDLF